MILGKLPYNVVFKDISIHYLVVGLSYDNLRKPWACHFNIKAISKLQLSI